MNRLDGLALRLLSRMKEWGRMGDEVEEDRVLTVDALTRPQVPTGSAGPYAQASTGTRTSRYCHARRKVVPPLRAVPILVKGNWQYFTWLITCTDKEAVLDCNVCLPRLVTDPT